MAGKNHQNLLQNLISRIVLDINIIVHQDHVITSDKECKNFNYISDAEL